MGNPFKENSSDLLVLDSKDIVEPSAIENIKTFYDKGNEQFHTFMKGIQGDSPSVLYYPIKKNKISFFKQTASVSSDTKVKTLKEDCNLFLYHAKVDSVTLKFSLASKTNFLQLL